MQETIEVHERLARLEAYKRDVTRRLENVEAIVESIQGIATNTAALAEAMTTMKEKIEKIDEHVGELENVPKKRYDLIVTTVLTGLVGAVLGYILSHMGL